MQLDNTATVLGGSQEECRNFIRRREVMVNALKAREKEVEDQKEEIGCLNKTIIKFNKDIFVPKQNRK